MRQWLRHRKTHCPLCNAKLVKNDGKLQCTTCNVVFVGDSCRFIDLPQIILDRYDNRKR